MEDNRFFVFRVSDSHDHVSQDEKYEPAVVNGSDLDSEWDDALRVFWKEREVVREMRRSAKRVEETGKFGPLHWLKWQDVSWKDEHQEGDDEEIEEEFWKSGMGRDGNAGRADTAYESRRDSGGGEEGKDAGSCGGSKDEEA